MTEQGHITLCLLLPTRRPEAADMWVKTWQAAYPDIDFEARRGWIIERIAEQERDGARSVVALRSGAIAGLLLVNPRTGYLDQIATALDAQRSGVAALLLAEARRLSPQKLWLSVNPDNLRAIRLYTKHGFVKTGEELNSRGLLLDVMTWTARDVP